MSPSRPTSNFTEPAKQIAALFKQKTGHEAILSFGASGPFFTQITHDAPFQVFLSADEARPKAAIEGGHAVPESLFTYAIGRLVLWSKIVDVTKGDEALSAAAPDRPDRCFALSAVPCKTGSRRSESPHAPERRSRSPLYLLERRLRARPRRVSLRHLPAQLFAPPRQSAILLRL